MAEQMIEPEPIEPIVPEVPEMPEAESAQEGPGGPGGAGQKRLKAVLGILKTDYPERYGNVDEKWLSAFIDKSPENAGKIRRTLLASGRINNLPDNDVDFVNMLRDTAPAPVKATTPPPAPSETPVTPEVPVEQTPAPAWACAFMPIISICIIRFLVSYAIFSTGSCPTG